MYKVTSKRNGLTLSFTYKSFTAATNKLLSLGQGKLKFNNKIVGELYND